MTSDPFKITVDDKQVFEIHPDEAHDLDLIPDGDGRWHILHKGKSFEAELLEADYAAHHYVLRVNGIRCSLHISDRYERLVQQLGLHAGGSQKMNAVKAPMPGLVLDILVKPGQQIQKGDPLLILEAMKMENVIKAGGEGTVKSVQVQKSAAVDKGQLLLEIE
ncbi:MAG: acetyl-CoA carboxylase biotin carboxyl carrier protein subunit [Lewinellaceae bacterium]|nr:acetyl-CoA carboxylase biotin carboxyl carrier protein subunit [Saprospiraceae bacterium]MCB9306942.1 acetyl-CoA carboxylase biotin carboxyl carrier protein subunit [Lewinellaceae bacterium]MCB9354274.1 acetyl-CoA carboxylase biotin carboxyl carrier protein subunit [Lewinellaceae bacterium]